MDKEYSSSTDREVYVDRVETKPTDDSGTGWAVALIVLILAIGFGFVAFSNNQASNDMKMSEAINDMRRDNLTNSIPPIVPPSTSNIEVKVPEIKAPEMPKVEVPKQVDVNVNPAPVPGVASGDQDPVE